MTSGNGSKIQILFEWLEEHDYCTNFIEIDAKIKKQKHYDIEKQKIISNKYKEYRQFLLKAQNFITSNCEKYKFSCSLQQSFRMEVTPKNYYHIIRFLEYKLNKKIDKYRNFFLKIIGSLIIIYSASTF